MVLFLTVLGLSFLQSVANAMASRSRNRSSLAYNGVMAIGSHGFWFLTFREIVLADVPYWIALPYITGATLGSVFGASISMRIEKLIGATT